MPKKSYFLPKMPTFLIHRYNDRPQRYEVLLEGGDFETVMWQFYDIIGQQDEDTFELAVRSDDHYRVRVFEDGVLLAAYTFSFYLLSVKKMKKLCRFNDRAWDFNVDLYDQVNKLFGADLSADAEFACTNNTYRHPHSLPAANAIQSLEDFIAAVKDELNAKYNGAAVLQQLLTIPHTHFDSLPRDITTHCLQPYLVLIA